MVSCVHIILILRYVFNYSYNIPDIGTVVTTERRGNQGTGKLSNLPKVTQLAGSRGWIQTSCCQRLCTGPLLCNLKKHVQSLFVSVFPLGCTVYSGGGGLVAKSCLTLLQPHGLWPSRLLCLWDFPDQNTWVGYHFLLQGIFPTRDWTYVSCIAGRFFTTWTNRKAQCRPYFLKKGLGICK